MHISTYVHYKSRMILESPQAIGDDPVHVRVPDLAVPGHPGVEVGTTDQEFPTVGPVARQGMVRILETIPEPANGAPAVLGKGLEGEVGVQGRGDAHAFDHREPGSVLADLGDARLGRCDRSVRLPDPDTPWRATDLEEP
jgi:hypothetical protein